MANNEMNPYVAGILQNLQSILRYHQSLGIENYPKTTEVTSFMRSTTGMNPAARAVKQVAERATAVERSERIVRPVLVKAAKDTRSTIQLASIGDIRAEVESCTGCSLCEERIVPVAGRGGEQARLLIVGDWLALPNSQVPPVGCLFGVEQDRMLGKMIEAIKFPKEEVFVTNIIKCGIPAACQPKAEHLHACFSYLQRQILTLQPQVILSMGMIATRTLLNRTEPLSRLRGKMHVCTTRDDRKIPLVATYHPTFLLQNPEMKKATWADLQLLAKQLGDAG